MGNDSDRNTINEPEINTPVPGTSLSLNAIFELLAHHHRRNLLRYLSDIDNQTATVDEITTHLIKREAQKTGRHPGHDQIEIALHHTHLPKLAEAGLIEYNARSKTVRYWPHDQITDLLEYVQDDESEETR